MSASNFARLAGDSAAYLSVPTWITSSATGSGTVWLGQAGFNTNATGVMFASHATGGQGFTPEHDFWARSGSPGPRDSWFTLLPTATLHWLNNSGQGTDPSTAYDTLVSYLAGITPAAECLLFGDPAYGHSAFQGGMDYATEADSFPYMVVTATNRGFAAVSPLFAPSGDSMDRIARGFWFDGGNHLSLVGHLNYLSYGLASMVAHVPLVITAGSGGTIIPLQGYSGFSKVVQLGPN